MSEPPTIANDLDDGHDGSWRERVVARSLGAATRQSLDRAESFVEAATALLQTSGESVTVQEVADKAGFSLRVLYRHFKSKEDLLAAVLETQLGKAAERMRIELAELSDPAERLARFIRLTIDVEPTPLNLALAKQEVMLVLSHPSEVVRAHAPMARLSRDLVDDAVRAGHIDPAIAEHAVYSVMAIKRSYHRACLLGDDFGLPLPTKDELTANCLRTLGIQMSTT